MPKWRQINGDVCVLHALYLAPGNRHVLVYTVFRDWVAYFLAT